MNPVILKPQNPGILLMQEGFLLPGTPEMQGLLMERAGREIWGCLKSWTRARACAGLRGSLGGQEGLPGKPGTSRGGLNTARDGDPAAGLENPSHEEMFPHIQSKSPLKHLEGVSLCQLREETEPSLAQILRRFGKLHTFFLWSFFTKYPFSPPSSAK